MTHIATVTSKRQLTIPASLFKKAKMSKGDKLFIVEKSGELRIKKANLLVKQLAGSVTVPKHLRGVNIDTAIKEAKKKHFNKSV